MLQKLDIEIEKFNSDEESVTYYREDSVVYGLTKPEHELWKSMNQKEPVLVFYCKELEPGIYEGGLNFEHEISHYSSFEAYAPYETLGKDGLPIIYNRESNNMKEVLEGFSTYGVADDINQIKEHFKDIINSENPVVISVTEIRKDEQSEEGGWRWHKWGEYIGKKEPQCEYIYDEPDIDSVYVYHIYAVRPKLEKNLIKTKKAKM